MNVYVVRQIQYAEVPVTARLVKMNAYVVRQLEYTEVPARAKLLPLRRSLFYDCCTSFVMFHTFSASGVVILSFWINCENF